MAVRICFSGKFSFRKIPPFLTFLGHQKRRLGIDFYTRLRSKVSIKSNNKQITAARNRTHTPETNSEISDGAAVAFWVLVILLFFQQFALAVVAFTVLLIFGLSSAQAFVQVSHGDTSVVLALNTTPTHTSFGIHIPPRHQHGPRSRMLAEPHRSRRMLADGPAGEWADGPAGE